MNCKRHPDKNAVTQCSACNAGMCLNCSNLIKISGGSLCAECFQKRLSGLSQDLRASILKSIISAAIMLILYITGLIFLIIYFQAQTMDEYLGAGAIFIGLSPAVALWQSTKYKSFIVRIAMLLLGLIFGIVITPVKIIGKLTEVFKSKKALSECEADIAQLQNAKID